MSCCIKWFNESWNDLVIFIVSYFISWLHWVIVMDVTKILNNSLCWGYHQVQHVWWSYQHVCILDCKVNHHFWRKWFPVYNVIPNVCMSYFLSLYINLFCFSNNLFIAYQSYHTDKYLLWYLFSYFVFTVNKY